MPFNSLSFLYFLGGFILLYYASKSERTKTYLLLLGSYVFYAFSNLFNVLCLFIITAITYYVANWLRNKNKKLLLWIGIILTVSLLLATKYSSTIFKAGAITLNLETPYWNNYILPLGISFYSLQAISLLVDVQTQKYKGELSFKSVALFLSMFPQSLAGPIHRADELIPQFQSKKNFQAENIFIGFKTMLWGFFCKLLVADKISLLASPVFDAYKKFDGLSIFIATLLYSLEIFFDFWGYSLVAMGVGKVLGYQINTNFYFPYLATSFKDFWHRWHISLSKWMRDYVYIPLGGRNQSTFYKFALSILITFLVSGFWHGITLNFMLWGFVHSILYLAELLFSKYNPISFGQYSSVLLLRLKKIIWTIFFFLVISFTWLIFRTLNLQDLWEIFNRIINVQEWNFSMAWTHYFGTFSGSSYLYLTLITLVLSHTKLVMPLANRIPHSKKELIGDSAYIIFCIVLIILWGDIGGQEFLYFNY